MSVFFEQFLTLRLFYPEIISHNDRLKLSFIPFSAFTPLIVDSPTLILAYVLPTAKIGILTLIGATQIEILNF
jgi:hypothetical protein